MLATQNCILTIGDLYHSLYKYVTIKDNQLIDNLNFYIIDIVSTTKLQENFVK